MSDLIALLPENVANQIAAGEVIGRPASVVKELLENSIDAGADAIILNIKDSGKTLIQVIDNGKGMSKNDSVMCFKRHATSKITKSEDLLNLSTKGFRGEAMASIASIAQVVLKTKQKHKTLGIESIIEGGKMISQKKITCQQGTNISVKNLFFNTPARRNFLKKDPIEYKHITDEFLRIALAHKEINFRFNHNDHPIYQLKPANFKMRLAQVFGKKISENLFAINEKTTLMNIDGFVGKPALAQKRKNHNYFFVNRRFIKIPYFHHAICKAFKGLIGEELHPSYFLFLEVPPESIDVNVHPNKTEIKFSDEVTLYQMIVSIIKKGLGKFNIMHSLDFQKENSAELPYSYKMKSPNMPQISVDPNFNPFEESNISELKNNLPKKPLKKANWETLYTEIAQKKLPLENITTFSSPKFFQIYEKYILTTIASGVILIHQNLAHQRILYEKFLKTTPSEKILSQKLLFPLELDFTPQEIELLMVLKKDLALLGFYFERLDEEKICMGGLPENIESNQVSEILKQLMIDFNSETRIDTHPLDKMAKSVAKSSAISSVTKLSEKQQESLVKDLFLCEYPNLCPNGKKTLQKFDKKNIDAIFVKNF